MTIGLWISSKIGTGLVTFDAESGKITNTPPIWSKFKNSNIEGLIKWLRRKTGEWPERVSMKP